MFFFVVVFLFALQDAPDPVKGPLTVLLDYFSTIQSDDLSGSFHQIYRLNNLLNSCHTAHCGLKTWLSLKRKGWVVMSLQFQDSALIYQLQHRKEVLTYAQHKNAHFIYLFSYYVFQPFLYDVVCTQNAHNFNFIVYWLTFLSYRLLKTINNNPLLIHFLWILYITQSLETQLYT